MLTLFWIEYSLLVSQKSKNICQREFIESLMRCLSSVERISNFTISNSSADFAALSASLFPCIPIWLGFEKHKVCVEEKKTAYGILGTFQNSKTCHILIIITAIILL